MPRYSNSPSKDYKKKHFEHLKNIYKKNINEELIKNVLKITCDFIDLIVFFINIDIRANLYKPSLIKYFLNLFNF
jgi:hypothetical protein